MIPIFTKQKENQKKKKKLAPAVPRLLYTCHNTCVGVSAGPSSAASHAMAAGCNPRWVTEFEDRSDRRYELGREEVHGERDRGRGDKARKRVREKIRLQT
jgi:hypothetical protein